MKLFSITKSSTLKIYKIFGIRIKIRKPAVQSSRRLTKVDVVKSVLYLRNGLFSTEDKVRYLSQRFYSIVGYYPNFKHPKSFNEKLSWIRFNLLDYEPDYICNKLLFKSFVEEQLGSGYTAKLLKVFDNVEDLNFDGLPERFVIKTTYGFGANAVCVVTDKSTEDLNMIKFTLSETINPWNRTIEHGLFRNNTPEFKIFVEEYLEDGDGQLKDYKFMCFNGEPKWVLACANRGNNTSYENYDMDWNLFAPAKKSSTVPTVERPENFDRMVEIAKKLSKPFPFVRIDFYNLKGKIYLGELTFIPGGGFNTYTKEYDEKFGEWLDLSKINPDNLNILPEFVAGAKTFIDPEIVESHVALSKKEI